MSQKEKLFKYITKLMMSFLKKRQVSPGERFFFLMPSKADVQDQYNSIIANSHFDCSPWEYDAGDYKTKSLEIGDTQLIIAAALENVKEDFLTGLRNIIDHDEFQSSKHAILFLLHSPLDSLIGGSDDLAKGGMPLHLDEISKSIKIDIENSPFLDDHEKKILFFSLDNIKNDYFVKKHSLFDFQVYLEVLGSGKLENENYKELGLFPDRSLKTIEISDYKTIEKRLNNNQNRFQEIENAHKYDHVDNYLEKHFLKKHFDKKRENNLGNPERYNLNDYTDIENWIKEKKDVTGVEYCERLVNSTEEGLVFWDRGDGRTTAKARIRNICIFNPENIDDINFTLDFKGTLNQKGLINNSRQPVKQLSIEKNNINVQIKADYPFESSFYSFQYNDSKTNNTFKFKIVVLPLKHEMLSCFETYYRILPLKRFFEITTEDDLLFNPGCQEKRVMPLKVQSNYVLDENFELKLTTDNAEYLDGNTDLDFKIKFGQSEIVFRYVSDSSKPEYIDGYSVWTEKRKTKTNFNVEVYRDKKNRELVSLQHGTKKFYAKGEFRNNIKREKSIIEAKGLAWKEYSNGSIGPINIKIPELIKELYSDIISYYDHQKLLPSTTFLNETLTEKYMRFLEAFLEAINIPPRTSLSQKLKDLSKLGTLQIEDFSGEKLILFTPLHPVNIAYQLEAAKLLKDEPITQQIAQRLGATNILPYLKQNKNSLYVPVGQNHSPEWIYYSDSSLGSQSISKNFVPDLIKQKIKEFKTHFKQIFFDARRPIIINLINMGDCSEALQGIFEYYQDCLAENNKITSDDIHPMTVHIFSKSKQITKFELLSQFSDPEFIKEKFNLNLDRKDYDPRDWLDLFHEKVHFYSSKSNSNNEYPYAHISFFQFEQTSSKVTNWDMEKVPSGLSLNGLLSDLPAVQENGNYRSCFGCQGEENNDNHLVKFAKKFNSFVHVSSNDDSYYPEQTTATVINSDVKSNLDGIYKASQWITFIDPKVDLSFFKDNKDVVIIHYSDQYNNSSGYDAITVTKKCSQYQKALKFFLEQNGFETNEQEVNGIIDIFNAVNGDWLLKVNTLRNRGYFEEEKISVLAGIKAGLAFLDSPDVTWIPVSLEEIVRVSGGIGLTQKDGLFSTSTLGEKGSYCDDILFMGIGKHENGIKFKLYPIEVKYGNINSGVINKAREQVLKTVELFKDHLQGDKISAKIYRNFFAKMALVAANKLSLYEVWPLYNSHWDEVQELQYKLLNDDFELDLSPLDSFGPGSIMAFNETNPRATRSVIANADSIYTLELFGSDSVKFLKDSVDDIKDTLSLNRIDAVNVESVNVQDASSNLSTQETFQSSVNEPIPSEVNLQPSSKLSHEVLIGKQDIILNTFKEFNVNVSIPIAENIHFTEGPSSIIYRIKPGNGVRPQKVYDLSETLKLNLSLPGEHKLGFTNADGYINIIVPKNDNERYFIDSTCMWQKWQGQSDKKLVVPLGEDQTGNIVELNFSSANSPHLLIGGTTGSGKSEALLTILKGMIKYYSPEQLRLLLIDPKGTELNTFESSDYLEQNIGWDAEDTISILTKAVEEMQRRYTEFKAISKRDLVGYNAAVEDSKKMPWWVIVLDEYADLTSGDSEKKDIEALLKRIAQKARAAGIHTIIATQKPSADVISTTLRSNLPAQLGLRVRSGTESRVIIGEPGAETLIGKGDAYFKASGKLTRIQCAKYN